MSKEALQEAVKLAGSQVALAEGIRARVPNSRVRQGHIFKWLRHQKTPVPPAEYVLPIAKHLGWRLTPHRLRPDLYPNPHDAMPQEMVGCACRHKKSA